MKKITLLFVFIFVVIASYAQWSGGTGDTNPIYRTGNVGIGTPTPSSKLHLFNSSGNTFLNIDKPFSASEGGVQFSKAGSTLFYLWNDDASDALKIKAAGETDASPRMEFSLANKNIHMALSGGNVGIGTNTPQTRLDLGELRFDKIAALPTEGSILEARWANYILGDASGPQRLRLGVSNDGYTRSEIFLDNSNRIDGTIEFKTTTINSGAQTRMFINGAGNVGIGTTTPQTKLDIDGLRLDSFNGFSEEGSIWEGKFPNYIIGDAEHQKLRLGVVNDGYTRAEIFLDNDNRIDGIIKFKTTNTNSGSQTRMLIDGAGNVGIGTGEATPDAKLAVNGQIHASEVKVTATVPGPDYVFEPDYALPTLESVKTYIDQNKHLPEVPSAKEMEANGINLSEMNMLLLKKVEELTLYLIEKDNQIKDLQNRMNEIKSKE